IRFGIHCSIHSSCEDENRLPTDADNIVGVAKRYTGKCVEVLSINFAKSLPSNHCIGTENITAIGNAVNFLLKRSSPQKNEPLAMIYFTVKARSKAVSLAWNYAYKMDGEFFAFHCAKPYST